MKSIRCNKYRMMAVVGVMMMVMLNAVCQEVSKDELEKEAAYFFNTERYEKAMPDYQSLHTLYPKDGKYAYFLGRCYLQTYQNLDQAVDLLKLASTQHFRTDAYFYLGMAYHLTYRFDDATLAFTTFSKSASRHDLKVCDVKHWQAVNQNAKKSVTVARQLDISNISTIPSNVPESAFAHKIPGKFVYVPDAFKSPEDVSMNYAGLMYLPPSLKVGDYLYFSSYSKNDKQGIDIYRVKQLASGKFSLPEALPSVINTPYDDAYPYFDEETGVLYFSSKGHNTSGGYDIFRSRFDSINHTWTTPEKLDFPINSTFDDFMFAVSDGGNKAVFLSDRNTNPRSYRAYTLINFSKVVYATPADQKEIRLYASMKGMKPEDAEMRTETTGSGDQASQGAPPFVYSKPVPVTKYDKLISEALDLQARSDSLNWIIERLKKTRHSAKAGVQKQQLSANISTLSKESHRLQKLTDEKFTEAKMVKDDSLNNKVKNNSSSQLAMNSGNIFAVKNYPNTAEKKDNGSKKKEDEAYNKGMIAARVANANATSEFSILKSSPYSDSHPIPYASLPPGLVFRIQLGAFSNRVAENTFKGLSPVNMDFTNDKGITKYYVGYFSSIEKAREGLKEVKEYGFPDAFLVCYYNKERISIEKAKEIEFTEK